MSDIRMIHGDCLQVVPTLPAHSIDLIATDLPYQVTACDWDVIIPFDDLWRIVKHALKPRGVFVTTASQPFTSRLVMSNLEWFKYEWIWDKRQTTGVGNVLYMPLRAHECIVVFSKNTPVYNPQLSPENTVKSFGRHVRGISQTTGNNFDMSISNRNIGYPKSILTFPRPNNITGDGGLHPTQKPTALYEYLIRTYTNPGDTVLDICAGSGTTIVAAINTGRNAIGIELREDYYQIAQRRIAEAQLQPRLFQDEKPKTQAKQEELF